jgi:hypothetical protein
MATTKLPHARKALREAERAFVNMRDSKSFEELEDAWKAYLSAIEKVWTKLEQAGKNAGTKFQPWFGTQLAFRKTDALLRYLKHARNADQHTLAEVVAFTPGQMNFSLPGGPGTVHIKKLVIGHGTIEYEGSHPPTITQMPPRLELLSVKDRGKRYNPPTEHLGIRLTRQDPLAVAEIGLRFHRDLLNEAVDKFFASAV